MLVHARLIGLFAFGLTVWPVQPSPAVRRIALPWGYIELATNEVSLISLVEDPPKMRLAAARGNSLGAISYNVLRDDGRQEEVALIQGKLDERYDRTALAGEMTLHLRRPYADGDAAMALVVTARSDGVIFSVPVMRDR